MTRSPQAALPAEGVAPTGETPGALALESWKETLSRFSAATGLTLALFDPAGTLRLGPLAANPLAEMLLHAGAWRA